MKIKRSEHINYDALPAELIKLLENMIIRTRKITILRGVLGTLAVAAITTLFIMAIDCSTVIESNTLRWSITGSGFCIMAITAYRTIYRQLTTEITLTDIARLVELNNPQLEERISSAIELVSEKNGTLTTDSKLLISDLVRKARVDINSINPQKELTFKTARPHVLGAAIIIPVLIAIFTLWPYKAMITFARALFPSSNLGNIYAEQLVITPGDCKLKAGESLTITVTTTETDTERVEFRRLTPDGREIIERMRKTGTEPGSVEFSLEIPLVEQSFRYRIMAKKALSRYYSVSIFQLPEVRRLTITTTPPKYSGKPQFVQENNNYVKALYANSHFGV